MYQIKLFIGFFFAILFVYLSFSRIYINTNIYTLYMKKKFELLGLPKVPNYPHN